ncbi:MAG: cytochrome c biogenesis CcdA family protein [Actinobacteria bacterium]|nr:cytochrome c biogenesis CcdA family protein [Actinomycetota bacterium]
MDAGVFVGGSLLAAVVAGTIALLAPCCFSVMLPAYFAGSVQNRRALVGMTLVYAIGVATVILPLALGAVVLRRLLIEQHTLVYIGGGLIMLAMAAHTLLGGELKLPMPSRKAGAPTGPLGVYSLGVFSGVASSCCAPVLAGVVALAGVAGSFTAAAALGGAYVFGMVAPLFVLAALWDRYSDRLAPLLKPRTVTWRIGPFRRTISGTGLATGVLLTAVGVGMIWTGAAGEAMPSTAGWQTDVILALQRAGRAVTDALAFVPDWLAGVLLLAFVALIVRTARRQLTGRRSVEDDGTGARTTSDAGSPQNGTDCCPAPTTEPQDDDRVPIDN